MERGLLEKVKCMRGKSSYRKIAAVAKNNEVAASCCFSHKSESIKADWLHSKQRQNRFDGINGSNNNLKYLSSVHGHDVMEISVFDFQSLKAKRRTFFLRLPVVSLKSQSSSRLSWEDKDSV